MTPSRREPPRWIHGLHASQKWSKTDEPLFDRVVRKQRRSGAVWIKRTEMTSLAGHKSLSWPDDRWGVYHPRTPFGTWADCSIEWDQSELRKLDAGWDQLTDIRIRTKGGFLLSPCGVTWVRVQRRSDGAELMLEATHMDLANTALRRRAWHEEADTLNRRWRRLERMYPGLVIDHSTDANRNQRLKVNRQIVQTEMLARTRMRNTWLERPLPAQGTHGKAILDLQLTNAPRARVHLHIDDASSDHRPIEEDVLV